MGRSGRDDRRFGHSGEGDSHANKTGYYCSKGSGSLVCRNRQGRPQSSPYVPLKASSRQLQGIRFDTAMPVGQKYLDRFSRWDDNERRIHDDKHRDPNMCRPCSSSGRRPPNGAVLGLEDGGRCRRASAAIRKWSSGSAPIPVFSDRSSLDAAIVPYSFQHWMCRPTRPGCFPRGLRETRGEVFRNDLGLKTGQSRRRHFWQSDRRRDFWR